MPTTLRPFDFDSDILRICDFLSSSYQPGNRDGNWIRPIWDWSAVREDGDALSRIGIWEDEGRIVGATIFTPGRVCLCAGPDHQELKDDMREYAEEHLAIKSDGKRTINIYAYEFDTNQEKMLEGAGYTRNADKDTSLGVMQIPNPFPEIVLPDGFLFKTLVDENNLRKIHRVLYRGFNHLGEPPEEEIESRGLIQTYPNFRRDLTILCEAPSGDYASYCGMWIDEPNRYCYVEPVATDPDYRRRGLGTATVMEGVRKSALLGAREAYVWSDRSFYESMGFELSIRHHCWTKVL